MACVSLCVVTCKWACFCALVCEYTIKFVRTRSRVRAFVGGCLMFLFVSKNGRYYIRLQNLVKYLDLLSVLLFSFLLVFNHSNCLFLEITSYLKIYSQLNLFLMSLNWNVDQQWFLSHWSIKRSKIISFKCVFIQTCIGEILKLVKVFVSYCKRFSKVIFEQLTIECLCFICLFLIIIN